MWRWWVVVVVFANRFALRGPRVMTLSNGFFYYLLPNKVGVNVTFSGLWSSSLRIALRFAVLGL